MFVPFRPFQAKSIVCEPEWSTLQVLLSKVGFDNVGPCIQVIRK